MKQTLTEPQSFLHRDELRHVGPLKMLSLFGSRVLAKPLRVGDELAYFPGSKRDVSQYDGAHYPMAE